MKRPHSLRASFYDALVGIVAALRRERNLRIHFGALLAVTFFGIYSRLSSQEWLLILLGSAFVIGSELFNSAIECVVDLVEPKTNPLAALAKQIAAGAVLVSAVTAAIIGLVVFGPRLWVSLFR